MIGGVTLALNFPPTIDIVNARSDEAILWLATYTKLVAAVVTHTSGQNVLRPGIDSRTLIARGHRVYVR